MRKAIHALQTVAACPACSCILSWTHRLGDEQPASLNELHCDIAGIAEISVKYIALFCEHHAREGAS